MHSGPSHVLGIDVPARTLERWRSWFAPAVQPFYVDGDLRRAVGVGVQPHLSLELQDSFLLYGDEVRDRVVGLDRPAFEALRPDVRASLVRHQVASGRRIVPSLRSVPTAWRSSLRQVGDGYRFVWWPDALQEHGDGPLLRFVADDLLASRHARVSPSTWERATATLPGAQGLAGTFADGSGPNCFGTVMGAAGVDDAADTWMLREPFEEWLRDATGPGGDDARPGTVLVWRDREGMALHAAVTLGDGWALHKPSQGWLTPRKVLSVRDVKRRGAPGRGQAEPADHLTCVAQAPPPCRRQWSTLSPSRPVVPILQRSLPMSGIGDTIQPARSRGQAAPDPSDVADRETL